MCQPGGEEGVAQILLKPLYPEEFFFHFIRILNPNSVQAAGRWVGSLDLSKIAPLVLKTILEHKAGCFTRTKVVSSGSFTLLDSINCF